MSNIVPTPEVEVPYKRGDAAATHNTGARLTTEERNRVEEMALADYGGNKSEFFRALIRRAWSGFRRRKDKK